MAIGNKENESVIGLLTFLSGKPIVFDIGSNKGDWADIILNRFGDNCDLHLFEPNKKLLSYTEIKYEYKPNIIYNEIAAYKENTDLEFHYFENFNNELSSIYKGTDWDGLPMQTRSVKAKTITTYCQEKNIPYIDYLKIDTEGADVDVLQGCIELMNEGKIGIIQLEYGAHYPRAKHTFGEVLKISEQTWYNVYYWSGVNYVKVNKNDFVEDFRAEDFFLTKFNIQNHSQGWNKEFIINSSLIGELDFVLEIGAFEGLTTKYIAENLLNEGGRIICVDPLENYYTKTDTEHTEMFKDQYQRFLRNTYQLPVELKRKESSIALPELNAFRFDLVFVDGDHSKDAVYFDACWAFAICKIGGFIILDDYKWRDYTQEGIDMFLSEFNGAYNLMVKDYQVLIEKTMNRYNNLTYDYYK
jgi:FkbM family methyltransferase